MQTIKAECEACGGTGLYSGMAEPKGVAVVCLQCDGTGCVDLRYKPFTARKEKRDIHTVRLSRGSFLLSCGPTGGSVSYSDFQRGIMPKGR